MSDEQPSAGLSRRAFLKGSGMAAVAGAAAGLPVLAPAAEAVPPQGAGGPANVPAHGPGAVKITLTVDGRERSTSVEPRVTLLDALRNYLDVTGCKRVCDRATCGACTVLLDGKAVYSCTTLALEAQDKKIKTAEALIDGGKLDAVPAAFATADAQQCGFCTPGFVVAMRAGFDKNPNASPAEIEEAVSGNICRCGTYEQMRDTIAALCKVQRKKEG